MGGGGYSGQPFPGDGDDVLDRSVSLVTLYTQEITWRPTRACRQLRLGHTGTPHFISHPANVKLLDEAGVHSCKISTCNSSSC